MGGEDPAAAEAGAEIDLLEDEDEAVGDRIMEVGGKASLLTILKKIDLLGNLTRWCWNDKMNLSTWAKVIDHQTLLYMGNVM